MSDMQDCLDVILKFRDERDWKQFHTGKDLALSLSLEAAEVLEHFQWKDQKQFEEYLKTHREDIADELADVFVYLLLMSHNFEIDLIEAFYRKMKKNEINYPVEKSKGNHKKYTEHQKTK